MNCKLLIAAVLCLSIGAVANTIYISTQGNDNSGDGSSSLPYATLGKAVSQCLPGDTVFIRAGTYIDGDVLIGSNLSGTAQKPTVIMGVGRDEVIFDGQWMYDVCIQICRADYIYVKNMTIQRYRPYYWHRGSIEINYDCASGPRSEGCLFEDIRADSGGSVGVSVVQCDNMTLRRVEARLNFMQGFLVGECSNMRVLNCRAYKNNPGYPEVPWLKYHPGRPRSDTLSIIGNGIDTVGIASRQPDDSLWRVHPGHSDGGFKGGAMDNVEVDDYESRDNYGPGMWYDTYNPNITVRNSRFIGSRRVYDAFWGGWGGGHGFMYEDNPNADTALMPDNASMLIENCEFSDNEECTYYLAESQNVTIRNSRLNGVLFFRDGGPPPRGSRHWIMNITVENNYMINSGVVGWAPLPGDSIPVRNIVFQNNIWQGAEPYIQMDDWYDHSENAYHFRIDGFENMKQEWPTFVGDTYSSVFIATTMRPIFNSVASGVDKSYGMNTIFDLRGRLIGCFSEYGQSACRMSSLSGGVYIILRPQERGGILNMMR